MTKPTNKLFSDSSLNIYEALYICGDGWWLDDSGKNWWNRKAFFPFNAIYLTKVGSFDLKINGIWYHITPNQLVFIPSGSELEFCFDGKGALEKYFVHFDLNYGIGSLGNCFATPCLSTPQNEARIEELFVELINCLRSRSDPVSSIAANGIMMSLVAETLLQSNSKFTHTSDLLPKEMREAVKYIENNYYKPISILKLAQRTGYSMTYFTKKFKQAFGCTPTEYITNLKIEFAKTRLKDNKMTIAQIAYALGFLDTSYFSNFFKTKTGLSPTYYRKKVKR